MNFALFHQVFRNFQLNTFNGLNFIVENINSCSDDLSGADTDNNSRTGACTGKLARRRAQPRLRARSVHPSDAGPRHQRRPDDGRHQVSRQSGRRERQAAERLSVPASRPAVSGAPQWTATGSIAWTPPIGGSGLRGLIYFDGRYMSKYNTGSDLDIEKTQNGYTTVQRPRWRSWAGRCLGDRVLGAEPVRQELHPGRVRLAAAGRRARHAVPRRGAPFPARSDAALQRLPRRAADLRRDPAGKTRLQPCGAASAYAPPPPPPPPPATQTCPDGSVIEATATARPPPPPPPPPPPGAGTGQLDREGLAGWRGLFLRRPSLCAARGRPRAGRARNSSISSRVSFFPSARVR